MTDGGEKKEKGGERIIPLLGIDPAGRVEIESFPHGAQLLVRPHDRRVGKLGRAREVAHVPRNGRRVAAPPARSATPGFEGAGA